MYVHCYRALLTFWLLLRFAHPANEAIAACRLINSEHVGLIHVKVRSGGFVDLTVRTADMDFTDQLLDATALRLK